MFERRYLNLFSFGKQGHFLSIMFDESQCSIIPVFVYKAKDLQSQVRAVKAVECRG